MSLQACFPGVEWDLKEDTMVKQFFAPQDVHEARNLKKNTRNSFFLAGGTLINRGVRGGEISLISLHGLGQLKSICRKKGDIHLGSMVTLAEISQSDLVGKQGMGELQRACRAISRNIRNMSTIGGCVASNDSHSDIIPSLVALNAHIDIDEDEHTAHVMPIEEYSAKRAGGYSHLIVGVRIPIPGENCRIIGMRFARTSLDLPTVKVAARFECDGPVIKSAIIAAGGIAANVMRLREIEESLGGKSFAKGREKLASAIAEIIEKAVKPEEDIRGTARFKKTVLGALLEDILEECSTKEGER